MLSLSNSSPEALSIVGGGGGGGGGGLMAICLHVCPWLVLN